MNDENSTSAAFFNRIDLDSLSNIAKQAALGNATILRKSLEEGHAHDVSDNRGWFPIHQAASAGQDSCVKILLEHDLEKNFQDTKTYNGETPIFLAALKGHDKVMTTLIEYGVDINLTNNELATVLIAAVKGRNKDCIKICLDNKVDVNAQDAGGWAALHEAVYIGDVKCTKLLLEAQARIDIQNSDQATPLFIASQHGHHDCLEVLLENKANICLSTKDKATPLFIASQEGHLECVQTLLDAGAKVKSKTTSKATALHTAAERGHRDVVKALIKAGADVNAKSEQGVTPLFLAADEDQVGCLIELIEAGADMNAKLKEDKGTPLELACSVGSVHCCEELVKQGCNPDRVYLKNGTLRTSTLMEAIDSEESGCASILLRNGADPNRLTYSYPIITAAKNCDADSILVLLNHGADVDVVDQAGNTALTIAIMKSLWPSIHDKHHYIQLDCVKKLLLAGADTKVLSSSKSPFKFAVTVERIISIELITLLLKFLPHDHQCTIKEYMHSRGPSYSSGTVQDKFDRVMQMLANPCSLMHFSRLKVRIILGCRRITKIKELPVPKVLQHYLEFEDTEG